MSEIDCIRVKVSDNGFLIINYTVKTKSTVGANQTYANVDYNDKEEVYEKDDSDNFVKRIFVLLGVPYTEESDEKMSDEE